jgi:hypothetical protein
VLANSKGWLTAPHEPNLAGHLFLCCVQDRNVFKGLKGKKKERKYFVTSVNYTKF